MQLLIPPGVFRPLSDSWMLAEALRSMVVPGARLLDVCTGSGLVAIAGAQAGANACATDISRRAAATVRINAAINRVRVRALRGDLFSAVRGERFDLISSNPPYVPSVDDGWASPRGLARAWEGGPSGRDFIDRLIDGAPEHLNPLGRLVMIHSSVCGLERTQQRMEQAGLSSQVHLCESSDLGPLMAARVEALEARGLLDRGVRTEEIAILVGQLG